MKNYHFIILLLCCAGAMACKNLSKGLESSISEDARQPNIVFIYADDLGYGDVGAYGATEIKTPNVDKLAGQGLKFTNGYASSATCTPSRYALLTGTYPWRNKEAKILPGSAPLIIDTAMATLPRMLKSKGYHTGIVGKWHLGLGYNNVDWNARVAPGPNELGFDYSYIMAATQDRVPTVYIRNGYVENLDPKDPIEVSYEKNFPGQPTGIDNPELLKMRWHHGHNNSIVNGIPRIGFMKGGESAKWVDEDMADRFLEEGKAYIKKHKDKPFFLFFPMQQPHVPRTPHPRFVGTSGMGPRGDVIVEMDWCVGELIKTLEEAGVLDNTLIIFTSDNGPVLNDGYYDDAVERLGKHQPAGPLRGGKYSLFEAGTRVPFITYWKGVIRPGTSDALVCQMDFFNSFSSMLGSGMKAPDSQNLMDVFLGKSKTGRDHLVIEATSRTALRQGDWLMIPPYKGNAVNKEVNIETGTAQVHQLYNLKSDIGQQNNLADKNPEQLRKMLEVFESVRGKEYGTIQQLKLE